MGLMQATPGEMKSFRPSALRMALMMAGWCTERGNRDNTENRGNGENRERRKERENPGRFADSLAGMFGPWERVSAPLSNRRHLSAGLGLDQGDRQ